MLPRIRFPKPIVIVAAVLFTGAGSTAMADTSFWGGAPGFLPAETAPQFIAAGPAPQIPAPVESGDPAFSEISGSDRLDPEALAVAIRADTERLANASDSAMVSSERDADAIGVRVVDAFERFAAIDSAGGYASRDYAMREPSHGAAIVVRTDPRSWTPAAPASLVAYDVPRN